MTNTVDNKHMASVREKHPNADESQNKTTHFDGICKVKTSVNIIFNYYISVFSRQVTSKLLRNVDSML